MRRLLLVLMGTMLIVGGSSGMAGAAGQTATTSIVVKMVKGLTAAEQAAVIARDGGTEKSVIPALRLHVITAPTAGLPLLLKDYQGDPQVESVEVNKSRKAETLADDQHIGVQWTLPKIGWDQLYGKVIPKGSAKVALLDTGIDATHPDLKANVIAGVSILDGSNGFTDPSGHGTQMAGIVAAVTGNGKGIAGVAYRGITLMPVTVLDATGTGQDSDIIQGIIWAADHGANVILMAFSNPDFSQHLQDAIDYAWAKGCVLVAATGNGGVSTPTFPAGDRGVIGISATDENDALAATSNYGTDTFLAAPGTNIYTTTIGGSYTYISGTSTSAAVVAGVAAFMKANDPSLVNGVILGRLAAGADAAANPGDPNYKLKYGYGRVSMAGALSSTVTTPVEPVGAAKADTGPVGPYAAAATAVTYYASPIANASVGTDGYSNMQSIYQEYKQTTSFPNKNRSLTSTTMPEGWAQCMVYGGATSTTTWSATDREMFRMYTPVYTDANRTIAAKVAFHAETLSTVLGALASLKIELYEYNDTNGRVGSVKGTYTATITQAPAKTVYKYDGDFGNAAFTVASGNRLQAVFYFSSTYAAPVYLWGSRIVPLNNGSEIGTEYIVVTESAIPVAPTATTGSAADIGATTATLNGTINANASSTTVTFEYGTTISYGSSVTATQSPVTGGSSTPVSASITGLTPGQLYHFRVKGVNAVGTTNGSDGTFTTDSTLAVTGPSSITYPATGTLQASGGLSGGAVSFNYVSGGCSIDGATVTITNAGSSPCVVTATRAAGGSNIAQTSANYNVTLNKAVDTPAVTNSGQTYTATAQTITVSCAGGGSATTITPATATNTGTTPVTASCPGSSNYNSTSGVSAGDFMINKATPTATLAVTNSPAAYTGSGQAATVGVTTSSVPGTAGSILTGGGATQIAVNSYAVTATFTPSDTVNYSSVTGLSAGDFVIAKATPTATLAVTNSPVTYTGSGQAATVSITTSSVPGTVGSILTGGGATQTAADSYAVTATFTPNDTVNYSSVTGVAAGNFVIAKATPTATLAVTNSPVTYTGSGQAATVGVTTSSVPGTVGSILTGGTATQTDVNSYAVTATFTPNDTVNYSSVTGVAAGTFVIGKASASVALSNLTQSYSGSALTPTAVTTPAGLTIDWTNAPQTNAGSYQVTATVNSNNYQGSNSGEFVIGKLTPTLSITLTQQTYDGASHGATIASSVVGVVSNIKYNGISTVPFTAGTYIVTADFAPTNSNYNNLTGASAGNFTIDRAVPTLAVTNSPLAYTGSAKSATVSGNVSGSVSAVTYNGSSTQPVVAGSYAVTASFFPADSTNYGPLTNAPAGSFTIAKATPTLGVSNSPVNYDGLGHSATVTGSVAGSVSGILTGGAATQSAVGTYAVTANFVPTDSGNYNSLTNAPAGNFAILAGSKVSVTIQTVPAGLTVTIDGGASQIAPFTFTATPGSSHIIATTSPQGSVGTRYLFSTWSDTKGISHTINAPNTGSATYTATFTTEYQLTMAVSPAGSGTVIPATNGWYAAGANPSIIATAGIGYGFSIWNGPAANSSSSATSVTMNGPVTVTATMKPLMATLSAAIGTATGTVGDIRIWPIILTPSASAVAVQINGLTVSSSGTCKPVVTSLFPLALGNIAAGASATGNVTVDFRTCSAAKQKTIKFNVTIGYSTNNGASTGSTSLVSVPQ